MYQTKELISIRYKNLEVRKLNNVNAMCFREVKNLCQDSDKKNLWQYPQKQGSSNTCN